MTAATSAAPEPARLTASPPGHPPGFNPSRRKSRRRALDVLYSADLRGIDPLAVLAETMARLGTQAPPHMTYAAELVRGVAGNGGRIDELLATYAEGWTLDRMPAVDRNLCRIAVYEMLYRDDLDDVVAISEAVELAEELSTDDSPRFVNGLLGRIAEFAPP